MTHFKGLGRQRTRFGRAAMGWMFVTGWLASGLVGCASSPAPAPETAAGVGVAEQTGGEKAVAQLEHESEPGPLQPVTVPGAFTGQIESNSPVEVKQAEGAVMLVADPGWGYPVRCFVYENAVDLGALLTVVLNEVKKVVQFKTLQPYSFNHDGMAPEIGVRGIYTVQRPEGKLVGDVKVVVAVRQERPVMCMTDGPGNAQGLARLLHGFASSLQVESELTDPSWAELWEIKVGELTVGFDIERTYEFEDGTAQRVTIRSMLMPVAPGQLSASDDARVTTVDDQRQITELVFYRSENAEPRADIKLAGGDKHYTVSGELRGKPFEQTFETPAPLLGGLAVEDRIRALAKARGSATFTQQEYLPSLDPAGAVEVAYEAKPAEVGIAVDTRVGELVMHLSTDTEGNGTRMVIPIGSQELQLIKVLQQGAP